MSYYTEEQALESIQKATNVDEIRKIIRQTDFVDHKAADNAISVFYQASMSPDKNDHVWKYLEQVQANSNGQIRMLNGSTDVIRVLYKPEVLDRIAKIEDVNREDPAAMQALRSKYYNGRVVDGVYQQGFWDICSENMAAHAKGRVWSPAPFGGYDEASHSLVAGRDNSVWAQTEMPTLLKNPDVTHINNIPKEQLIEIQKTHGLDGVYDTLRAQAQQDVRHLSYNLEITYDEQGRSVRNIRGIDTGNLLSEQYGINDIHALKPNMSVHNIANQMDAMAQEHPQLVAKPAPLAAEHSITDTHLRDPMVQTIGGLNRTDLATLNDELINRYKYTPSQALEAVNARVTLNSAVEDFKAGKGLNTSDEVLRSQAIVRQTTTVMGDSVANAAQVEIMNRQFTAYNSVLNHASPELIQANLAAIDKPITPSSVKVNTQTNIDLTPTNPKTTSPLNGYTKQFNQITATEDALAQEAHAAKQVEQASKRIERQHITNEPIKPIQLEVDIKNGIKAEAQIAKTLSRSEHLAAGLESGLSKVAGKALVGVGVIDAAVTISNDVEAAQRTANNRKEELTKGTVAFSKGVMQESGVDLAVSAVDAAYRLNPFSTIQRMVDNQTFNPVKGIGEEVQQNAQAREPAYTQFGETTGNSLYNTFSKEGSSKAEADKLTQAIPNITDPEARKTAETLRDAFAQTAHEEHLKNQNRIAGVHGVMNSYDDFIAKNPRYTDISKDDVVDETNKLTGNGMAAGQAVPTGYNNLKQQLDTENAERLAKLSPADREATLKVMERNPSASVRTASELVELANNRGMTTMGGAPIGENMYKAALAKMEEANYKADPTYGKDANDRHIDSISRDNQVKRAATDDYKETHGGQAANLKRAQEAEKHMMDYWKTANKAHEQKLAAQSQRYHGSYEKPPQYSSSPDKYNYVPVQVKPSYVHHPKQHHVTPQGLRQGAHGESVKQVQHALNALGAHVAVDGHFGSSTTEALKAFQKSHHLTADGELDRQTAKVLVGAVQAEHVKHVQSTLNTLGADLKVNGHMDASTVAAVKAFQTEHHLQPTGKLDERTSDAMTHALHAQQRMEADRSVTPVQPQQPQTQSTSSPQIEQMVSTLSASNPTFAALAPDVQMTMAAHSKYQKAA